ncbi:MAG: hypothetical protein K2O14_12610 [Oscillospiraceae bacterium]|nr:hypothetical protein [Oscillospiraceae bacterium]
MKIIKKITAIALATCMALSFTAAAQTAENEEDTAKIGNFIVADIISDNESKADENGLVHWSDILGYGLDTVKNELAENPPAELAGHNEGDGAFHSDNHIGTFTKDELEEFGLWEPGMNSNPLYTKDERRYIIDRLSEVKEPEDEYIFNNGDIYIDISWRGKTVSSEGFPGYMPDEYRTSADVSDGYFGLKTTSNTTLKSAKVDLYGFPNDKIFSSNDWHNEF